MAKVQVLDRELRVKIASRQIEFLENRVKELGLSSMAELVRWYIVNDMIKAEQNKPKGERISLEGIVDDGRVTEEDIEEVIKEWNKTEELL